MSASWIWCSISTRSTLSWMKSFSQARSKKRASRSCLRGWSILINWSSGNGQCPALTSHQHRTQDSNRTRMVSTLQAADSTVICMEFQGYCGFHWTTFLLFIFFIFIFRVSSGDMGISKSNIKPSFHHFGPNVEITDRSIIVPSFPLVFSLSLSLPGRLCWPPTQTQLQLPTNTAVARRGQDSTRDGPSSF